MPHTSYARKSVYGEPVLRGYRSLGRPGPPANVSPVESPGRKPRDLSVTGVGHKDPSITIYYNAIDTVKLVRGCSRPMTTYHHSANTKH